MTHLIDQHLAVCSNRDGKQARGWLQSSSSNPFVLYICYENVMMLCIIWPIFKFQKSLEDVKKEGSHSSFLEHLLNRRQAMLGKYSIMLIIAEVLIQETSLSLPSCHCAEGHLHFNRNHRFLIYWEKWHLRSSNQQIFDIFARTH